jgi:hypothetical protein
MEDFSKVYKSRALAIHRNYILQKNLCISASIIGINVIVSSPLQASYKEEDLPNQSLWINKFPILIRISLPGAEV